MALNDNLQALDAIYKRYSQAGISTTALSKAMGWGRGRTVNALQEMIDVGWVTTTFDRRGCVVTHRQNVTWRGIMVLSLHCPDMAETHGDNREIGMAASDAFGTLRHNFRDGVQFSDLLFERSRNV